MGSKPPKAKKMMLDFDESDEEGDEDDAQDAELRRFETNFIFRIYWNLPQCFYFVIITSQVQKRVHSGKRPGSFGLVEEQEGAVSDAGETGQEVPVCSGHKHPGRACVQLDGFPVEQEEAQPVW